MLIWDCYCSCLIRGWHTNTQPHTHTNRVTDMWLGSSVTDWESNRLIEHTAVHSEQMCAVFRAAAYSIFVQQSVTHSFMGQLTALLCLFGRRLSLGITHCFRAIWNDPTNRKIKKVMNLWSPKFKSLIFQKYLPVVYSKHIHPTLPSLSLVQLSAASVVLLPTTHLNQKPKGQRKTLHILGWNLEYIYTHTGYKSRLLDYYFKINWIIFLALWIETHAWSPDDQSYWICCLLILWLFLFLRKCINN